MGVKGLYYASSWHGYCGAVGAQQRQQCALGDGRAGRRGGCAGCQVCGSGWFGPGVVLVQPAQEGARALPAKLAKGAGPAAVLSSGSCQGPGLLAELVSKPPTALLHALLFSHKTNPHRAKVAGCTADVAFQAAAQYAPLMDAVCTQLEAAVASIPGASVEHNKFCVSVHFRNCAPGDWPAVVAAVDGVAAGQAQLRVTRGRKVLEVRPQVCVCVCRCRGCLPP